MIKSILLRSPPSPLLLESKHRLQPPRAVATGSSPSSSSSSSRNSAYIPKLEPFSRSKLERALKEPPLIEKAENELADYCSTLEGDPSYSCWRAYFELKDLERESKKEDVEKLILQAGGVKSLIGCLHGIALMLHKGKSTNSFGSVMAQNVETETQRLCPIPDGLPKTQAELDEEESARMPDSAFTRLLRAKGTFPAWYSPAPDHETD